MPGFRRFLLNGYAYHTSSATEGRQRLFESADLAAVVVDAIAYVRSRKAFVLAYAVMPDHLHVVAVPREGETIATVMQSIRGFSSHEINRKLGRRGRLWQPSYYDRVIQDEEQLLAAVRYVEWNPVEDGLVAVPEDYPFSSAAIELEADYGEWLR